MHTERTAGKERLCLEPTTAVRKTKMIANECANEGRANERNKVADKEQMRHCDETK